ncbi:MAG: glycosyltransferase [Bacteroides sp.]|nr:glycosyltransferase [Bacteroides sp.]
MITVSIPIWNVQNTIERTIRSVFNQTYTNYEILVIDDKGSDNSMAIVETLQKTHPQGRKIRIIQHQHNRSLGTARNSGIDNAYGDYIYFLDGDDIMLPDCLQKMIAYFDDPDLDFVAGSTECRRDNNLRAIDLENFNHYQLPSLRLLTQQEIVKYALIQGRVYIPVWNKLYRLSFLRAANIRAIDGIFTEDEFFSLQTYLSANKCILTKEITYIHYKTQKNKQKTNQYIKQKIQDYLEITRRERALLAKYEQYPFYWDVAWRIYLLHYGEFAQRLKKTPYNKFVSKKTLHYLSQNPIPHLQRLRHPIHYINFFLKFLTTKLLHKKYKITIPRIND